MRRHSSTSSGFPRRSLTALAIFMVYEALMLAFLYTPIAKLNPEVSTAIVALTSFLLPAGLLCWTLTGRVLLAALMWPLLMLGFAPLFVVARGVILWVGGGHVSGGGEEAIATLVLAQMLLYVALVTLIPLAIMAIGSVVHLWRLKPRLVTVALVAIVVAYAVLGTSLPADLMKWMASPPADQDSVRTYEPIPTSTHMPVPTPSPSDLRFISLMEQYIKAQYNPDAGLFREAPNVAPDKYWVYSDAYLVGLDVSKWNVPVLAKWTVLVAGAVVPNEVFTYRHKNLDLGNGVWSEAHDTLPPYLDDWPEYADRILLAAMNAQNAGKRDESERLMTQARSMWSGKGMKDKFYRTNGYFQTYHTALYYCMTGDRAALEVLQAVQELGPNSNRFGGIYTEYDDNGKPLSGTDTNVETTAVTLLCARRQLLQR